MGGQKLSVLAAIAVLALVVVPAARGEERVTVHEELARFHRDFLAAGHPQASPRPKWGTASEEYVNVHAYTFQANWSTDPIYDDGNGYRYFNAPIQPYMAAPLQLPAGAFVNTLGISACTAHAGDLVVGLWDNAVGGEQSTNLGFVAAVEGCAVSTFGLDPPYTNTYNVGHPLYVVVYFPGETIDSATKFNDVWVGFQRQIAPAPGQATFADVPTSDPAFQHVEALFSSGITAGCSGTEYCPDNFVTRRQMAVFLAKALGLHWLD